MKQYPPGYFKVILVLLLAGTNFLQAQYRSSPYLVSATSSASGASVISSQNNQTFAVQQSVAQRSVIGTFKNAEYTIRQGFMKPNVFAKITGEKMLVNLKATFYPNPFIESVTLAFTEKIEGNIKVVVFDMIGKVVFSKNYKAKQKLAITFHNLSIAAYILKVTTNNKQFFKNIIKQGFR